jgi:hypothetical protein
VRKNLQKGVSPIDAEKQLPKFVSPIRIVEDCKRLSIADVLDELHRTGEVLIQSKPKCFIFLPGPGLRPAAILWRTIAGTADAAGIMHLRLGGALLFQPHLMFPRNIEIVFVQEPASAAQPQCVNSNVWRSRGQLP